MLVGINKNPYDINAARGQKDYARRFTYGWETCDIKRSADFVNILTTRVWTPIIYGNGHRRQDNFQAAQLLVLDFDSPLYPLSQAINEWCDTVHWIGTTKSHQRDKGGVTCDRFRLVVPYTDVIRDLALYRYNYAKTLDQYDADGQTKDGARLFFPCQEVVSVNLAGELQPILPLPEDYRTPEQLAVDASKRRAAIGYIPNWVKAWLRLPVPTGERNTTWFRLGAELARYGFEPDEITKLVLASKTYEGSVMSHSLIKEIQEAVNNGHKKSRREL